MTMWKWDVDRKDPLVRLRIPVTSEHPVHSYIAVFDKDSPHRPTNREAYQLRSFIDQHMDHRFTTEEMEESLRNPFDVHVGVTPMIFHKYGVHDWGYRCRNWQTGTKFTPPSPRVPTRRMGPLSLVAVMDLIHGGDAAHADRWRQWKLDHPDVFG